MIKYIWIAITCVGCAGSFNAAHNKVQMCFTEIGEMPCEVEHEHESGSIYHVCDPVLWVQYSTRFDMPNRRR
jgi:hypothetical protein